MLFLHFLRDKAPQYTWYFLSKKKFFCITMMSMQMAKFVVAKFEGCFTANLTPKATISLFLTN